MSGKFTEIREVEIAAMRSDVFITLFQNKCEIEFHT